MALVRIFKIGFYTAPTRRLADLPDATERGSKVPSQPATRRFQHEAVGKKSVFGVSTGMHLHARQSPVSRGRPLISLPLPCSAFVSVSPQTGTETRSTSLRKRKPKSGYGILCKVWWRVVDNSPVRPAHSITTTHPAAEPIRAQVRWRSVRPIPQGGATKVVIVKRTGSAAQMSDIADFTGQQGMCRLRPNRARLAVDGAPAAASDRQTRFQTQRDAQVLATLSLQQNYALLLLLRSTLYRHGYSVLGIRFCIVNPWARVKQMVGTCPSAHPSP